MGSIIKKEMKLSASPLAFWFIAFGVMFMLPGYPVLCGAFFITLGLYQSFMYAREANDVVFSALLPVAKSDVVKGRFWFCIIIQMCGFLVMAICTLIRLTAFVDAPAYRANALMTVNGFALGMALLLFGVFNIIFVRGFFKTAYKMGKVFIIYILVSFLIIGLAEGAHYVPGLSGLNAFGFEYLGLQLGCLLGGAVIYIILTVIALNKSKKSFELIDL